MSPPLILASGSPRRIELLREAGFAFQVEVAQVEEAHHESWSCEALTIANATTKAMAVAALHPEAVTLGADTLVYLNGLPFGKPRDLVEASAMLALLSGRTHQVCTGVALVARAGADVHTFHVISEVTFQELTSQEISAYHALVNPLDKAGAYGIQSEGARIIASMTGSRSNVMGLPMERVVVELPAFLRSLSDS